MHYRAFISYSHTDEVFAARLHRDLERYRLPARVVRAKGLISNRLGVIFRDREELASSASLTETTAAGDSYVEIELVAAFNQVERLTHNHPRRFPTEILIQAALVDANIALTRCHKDTSLG